MKNIPTSFTYRKFLFCVMLIFLGDSSSRIGASAFLEYPPITIENVAYLTQVAELPSDAGWIRDVAFSPTEDLLAFGTQDGAVQVVQIHSISEMAFQWRQEQSAQISSIAFNYDGTLLASGSVDGTITVWDVSTGNVITSLNGHDGKISGGVLGLSFHPSRNLLASSSGDMQQSDNTVKLWDLESESPENVLSGHNWQVTDVAFSPDGQLLASSDGEGAINIWGVAMGQLLHSIEEHQDWVLDIQFNPAGDSLVSVGRDKNVFIWDIPSGDLIASFHGHTNAVYSANFNSDGTLLITSDGDGLVLGWNVATGEQLLTLQAHKLPIVAAVLNSEGNLLVTGSTDDTIKLWAVTNT